MENQSAIKEASIKEKIKPKLDNNQINEKISISQERIKVNCDILKTFVNNLEPHNSLHFIKALQIITNQYSCLVNFDVPLEERKRSRICNANTFISIGIVDVIVEILIQLFSIITPFNGTEVIDENLYNTIKKLMFILFNYSDASMVFGDEICKRDKLHVLYYRVLASTKDSCMQGGLTDYFSEIVRTVIATLYNTLIYYSDVNLQKIRQMKYLDIIKEFLTSSYGRIKISSLLFTAYVANESESVLFRTDQQSITYLLKLLSESMRMKSERAKGLSTEEIAKGIEKLSKNDENKQLLVDLDVLPLLKKLMAKESIKYKQLSLKILWSLSFDERNRKIINKTFSSVLSEMKTYLNGELNDTYAAENHNKETGRYENHENVNESLDKKKIEVENVDSEDRDLLYINMAKEKTKCSKVLDGLLWTLQDNQNDDVSLASQKKLSVVDKKSDDGHIMISYCRANTELVMKIYNAVKSLGYKLWIDRYNMADKENLMESMAQAVENSIALIICISNGYKNSTNCRAEAQYAVTKKKPIIPVMVQEKYRPDGWLGFCISGLQYCDFNGKHPFEDGLNELSKQLARISTVNQNEVDIIDHITPTSASSQKSVCLPTSDICTWSNCKVIEWLKSIQIKKIIWNDDYDGRELAFLKALSTTCLLSFFQVSESKLGLTDLRDMRIFYENIQNI